MKKGGDEERSGADEQTGKTNADEDWGWWDKRKTEGRKKTTTEDLSTCGVTFVGAWRHRSAMMWVETAWAASDLNTPPALYIAIMWLCFSWHYGFDKGEKSAEKKADTVQEEAEATFHLMSQWVWSFYPKTSNKTGFSRHPLRLPVALSAAF